MIFCLVKLNKKSKNKNKRNQQSFLQQESFIWQPQQEFPFLRLFMAPIMATITRPVTAMIAIIVEAFIRQLVQLNSQTMLPPRLQRTGTE